MKKINLLEAWKQVNRDSSLARNTPVLMIHFDDMPKDTWLTVIHSETFLDYIKKDKK